MVTSPPAARVSQDDIGDPGGIRGVWGLFREGRGPWLLFLAAVVIGFFHGWMKLHYRSSVVTFAFDIPLTLALLWTVFSVPRGTAIFPEGPVGTALKFLVGTCAVYGFLPFGVPGLVSLAAFRGWCFIPLVFLLGYHLSRTPRQMEWVSWLLMGLGLVTALYGLRQSPAEVRAMIDSDPYLAYRLQGNFYGSADGSQFRVFSTFVSSAAFGGTMAFCAVFALAQLTRPAVTRRTRIGLAGLAGLFAYGVVLSGSRTSLVMFLLALGFTAWFRGRFWQVAMPAAIVVGAMALAGRHKGGAILERFATLLDYETVHGRLRIVYGPTLTSLAEAPFGGGLGRSGHGVPAILNSLVKDFDWKPVDGDLGRLAVEMGLPGLVVFFATLLTGAWVSYRVLRDVRGTPLDTVLLPAGAWFLISAICMPIGSPFLSIPVGPLTWFLLGSVVRLHETRVYENHRPQPLVHSPRDRPFFPAENQSQTDTLKGSANAPNRPRRFLYGTPAGQEKEPRR